MSNGIYIAASGAMARAQALDVHSNNIANSMTPGFRLDEVVFREQPAQPAGEPQRPDTDIRLATVDAVVPSWETGTMMQTENRMDLAIQGDGLLSVRTEEGVRYSRGGSLLLDSEGTLMTSTGYPLLDVEGEVLRLPPEGGELNIAEDGTVHVGEQQLGRLQLTWFQNPQVLSREGDNLFSAPEGAERAEATGTLQQGYQERSSTIRGLLDIITVTRSYETSIRMIESFKQIDQRTARDIARG